MQDRPARQGSSRRHQGWPPAGQRRWGSTGRGVCLPIRPHQRPARLGAGLDAVWAQPPTRQESRLPFGNPTAAARTAPPWPQVVAPEHARTALTSIFRHNFKESFAGHFVDMRSYVLGEEAGLTMASYPNGQRPRFPFPYFNEVMSGFEYSTAAHMLYEGQVDAGLRCIRAIRDRYDGRKRNPFNEAECGHHYARAMAAWAAVVAWTGFRYSGVTGEMVLRAGQGRQFWSNGYAWGTCAQTSLDAGWSVDLRVLGGRLRLRGFALEGAGRCEWAQAQELGAGAGISFQIGSA